MASACIANCLTDARLPVRATYVNLHKWPESDAEFVKSVSSNGLRGCGGGGRQPKVVDSVSCRQLYLRSYTFSRKETVPEKTRKCLGRVRDSVTFHRRKKKSPRCDGGRKKRAGFRRAKAASCAALLSIFRRLLSCTTEVAAVG